MADLDSAEHLMASFVGQEKLLVVVRQGFGGGRTGDDVKQE